MERKEGRKRKNARDRRDFSSINLLIAEPCFDVESGAIDLSRNHLKFIIVGFLSTSSGLMARDSPLELEITNSPAGKKKPGNPLAEQFFFLQIDPSG